MRKIHLDPVVLRELVEHQKLQQWAVAQRLGVSRDTVGQACKDLGIATQRTGPRSGSLHTGWKGGRRVVKGYVYLHRPDHPRATKSGYVAEHRLVMESVLGRFLEVWEVVHHKNDLPADNRPDNLELFANNASHLRATLSGQCPTWTPEGLERIERGLKKRTNQILSGVGVPQRNQTTGRWIAKPGKQSQGSS